MKKILLTGLFFALFLGLNCAENAIAVTDSASSLSAAKKVEADSSQEIKEAIEAYKKGDYLACISILKDYTMRYDDNAIAWYYLGSSYMNIAMINEANEAFDKVISLSTTSKLTSYAIQAQLCMRNPVGCKYENFTAAEVRKLRDNPAGFLQDYYRALRQKSIKTDDVIQIENLINGTYINNIHPQAQDFILTEKAKIKAAQINSK